MANNDVSPKLLKNIQKAFESNLANNKSAEHLLEKIEGGKARYSDAVKYAECVGESLSKAMSKYLNSETLPDGVLYWHIAKDALEPLIREEYDIVSIVAAEAQGGLNRAAGIGLKPLKTKYNKSTVENILGMAANADQFDDIATEFGETMVTFARDIVGQTLKENIDFQGETGRSPRIIRTAGANCCPWCADLEGTYDYPNVPADVYKYHDYCKCDLEYEDRYSKDAVWTKPKTDPEVLEQRKTYGL